MIESTVVEVGHERSCDVGPVTELPSAREIEVRGIVQGVGFRPFVWRLASGAGLTGRVRNRSGVVEIVVEGAAPALDDFCSALETQAPVLARVDSVTWRDAAPTGFETFDVDESVVGFGGNGWFRRTPPRARAAWKSCSNRTTAGSGTRSSTAPIAGRASPSSRRSPTTASARACAFPMCADCARSITIRPTAGSTRSRSPAPPAGRAWRSSTVWVARRPATRSSRRRRSWPTAGSSR